MTTPASDRPVVGAPGWRLSDEGGYLVATAGPDEVWVVDDVPGTIADELAACWSPEPPTPAGLSPAARLAVEQLRAIGMFGTPVTLSPLTLALAFAGADSPDFRTAFAGLCHTQGWQLSQDRPDGGPPGAADVVTVVVRTTATMQATAELTSPLVRSGALHVLCDLSSAHTVALGPFVAPGHSACVGCLAGRVQSRWGDPAPPEEPGAASLPGSQVAAGLLARQLELAVAGRFPLVDACVSIDLDTLDAGRSPCLRSAQCGWCGGVVTDGRLSLPWAP
ncbi:TOMM precursor leader peptide-binding protein [Ruania alba]|uniref:Bacteriocin biosynthesis cyclodehydratase domain-containing protein n=1 Tax=Ruania alba TaxID=648782 RepID=A0A1H5MMG1_9MICO|nr:TOMM precursor leader peptide-binding protein [Ruania alba]SEE89821.1 bacteriocin biosynthesis cyclodehydratase domain-containing protein [Ruania alba]